MARASQLASQKAPSVTNAVTQTNPIRILIADDHTVVRRGLRALLFTEPGLEVIGEAADGAEAVVQAHTLQPHVILLDMQMPRLDGLGVIKEITKYQSDVRILVLTSFSEEDKLFPAIKAGALGYLLKDCSADELIEAIRAVARGEAALHPTVARKVLQELRQPTSFAPAALAEEQPAGTVLTERELEVLRLVAEGLSNQDIADRLIVSERTVRTHVSAILGKLQLANRTQAALYALREGFTTLTSLD